MADLEQMPDDFRDDVEVDEKTGCWIWFGPVTPKGNYPAYHRRAAWRAAYETFHRTILPKYGQFPTIPGCIKANCVNPDHRVGLPTDIANVRHQCPWCKVWHDPE